MKIDSYKVLKRLRRNLLLPYVLLVMVTIAMDGVLYFSADRLNNFSKESSTYLFNRVANIELQSLSRLNREYSFWYETIDKLAVNFDPVWVVSNLQVYLRDKFNISRVFVVKPDLSVLLSIDGDQLEQELADYKFSPGMQSLFGKAIQADANNPQPATGMVLIDGQPYLAAVSTLIPDVVVKGLDANKSYGILVFAKSLASLLPGWSEDFQFGSMSLLSDWSEPPKGYAHIEIKSPIDQIIGIISLRPELPGDEFISDAIPWVSLFALLALALSLYFVIRVNLYSRAAKQTITDLHKSENEFRLSQQKLQNVIDGAHLGYWDWDYLTGEHQVNDRWLEIIGLERSEIHNHISDWIDRIHPEDSEHLMNTIELNVMLESNYSCDFRIKHKDGHWVWVESSGSVVEFEEGKPRRLSGTYQDISERKEFEAWLEEQAAHDHLTGLYNRAEMDRHFRKELDRSSRYQHGLSIFMIDIDHFKKVNDDYGHQMGDTVLKAIAGVLTSEVRQIDTVARFGGEEFVLILPETPEQKARDMAERLRAEVAATIISDGVAEISVTVSIGIATFPDDGTDPETLLSRADAALYEAKHQGRNRVQHARDMAAGTSEPASDSETA
ncbi:MAG: hypothetical protein C0631_13790 [Sedimenticola sp.]|nr:MAG: hypothetical protein C0631_13790 [Sedimenticola sp.]